jgi:hypothetical protein
MLDPFWGFTLQTGLGIYDPCMSWLLFGTKNHELRGPPVPLILSYMHEMIPTKRVALTIKTVQEFLCELAMARNLWLLFPLTLVFSLSSCHEKSSNETFFLFKKRCSRALRCTFFGEWKNLCSSKFVQLELLNKAKARSSKNCAA